jgi:hypothetical protein
MGHVRLLGLIAEDPDATGFAMTASHEDAMSSVMSLRDERVALPALSTDHVTVQYPASREERQSDNYWPRSVNVFGQCIYFIQFRQKSTTADSKFTLEFV